MFWLYLPRFLLAVQFPYRLLMFATTFGTIAAGLVLTAVERKSRGYAYGIFGLALAILLGSFWWHANVSETRSNQIDNIDFANGATDYFELNGSTPLSPGQSRLPRSAIKAIGNVVTANVETSQQGSIVVPVQYSERLTASVNSSSNEIVNTDGLVSLTLPVGSFNIRIQREEPVGFLIGPCIATALFGLLALKLRRENPGDVHILNWAVSAI
jgi:4-amino-4-deoxy-L-arabinose transferase-like glycosyltransferase